MAASRGVFATVGRLRYTDAIQRGVIGLAGTAELGTYMLMATVMAVLVGRRASPFTVSMVGTVYFVGMLGFAPIWGAIADITGRRRAVLLVISVGATLSILPLVIVTNVWHSIGLRLVYALFAAGFLPVMMTIVSERGGADGRGRSVGFFNSSRSFGSAGANFLAGVLLVSLLPGEMYAVIAGVGALLVVSVLFVEDPTPRVERSLDLSTVAGEVRRRLVPLESTEHLRINGLSWLYVVIALRNVTVLGVMAVIPVYIVQTLGLKELLMGTILGFGAVIQVTFLYLFGRITDRIGRKPLITLGALGHAGFTVLAASAVVPESAQARLLVVGLAFVAKGLAFSAFVTGGFAFIGDVAAPGRESELMGLRSTAKGVGGVVGPVSVGIVADIVDYQTAFLAASILLGVAAVLTYWGLDEPTMVGARADGSHANN